MFAEHFSGFHLLDDNFKAVLCPFVQISQIHSQLKHKSLKWIGLCSLI